MGIALITAPTASSAALLPDVRRRLADRSVATTVLDPTVLRTVPTGSHELYVLLTLSGESLRWARMVHGAGEALINPYPASAIIYNKVLLHHVLREAAIPLPATFTASSPLHFEPLLASGPLIIRPYRSGPQQRVEVVRFPIELYALPANGEVIFAQRYHQPDSSYTIAVIGEQICAMHRLRSQRDDRPGPAEPCTPPYELLKIARRCGAVLGIDLFSVEIVVSGGRPYVMDMASLDDYAALPDGARLLADYLYAAAMRVREGEPLLALTQAVGA